MVRNSVKIKTVKNRPQMSETGSKLSETGSQCNMLKLRSIKDLQTVEEECEIVEIETIGGERKSGNRSKRQSESEYEQESVSKCRRLGDTVDTVSVTSLDPGVTSELSSVQVLGVDLLYRSPHTSNILFKTSPVLSLLAKCLPLAENSLNCVVEPKQGDQRHQKPAVHQDISKETFISWKALRSVLNSGLLDLAVRDLLLATRRTTDKVPTIAGDTIVFHDTEVKFKVRAGVVYLDVLSAFSVLGRLHDALHGNWISVDNKLAAKGISQKTAFKKRGSVSGRSYMTLQAFKVIADGNDMLTVEAEAVIKEVEQVLEKKNALCRELEQTVEMIIRTSCITPRESRKSRKEGNPRGAKLCHKYCANTACGQGYHIVRQCCNKNHTLQLGDVEVGYVKRNGQVFLEKCAAFGALGRMFVIRCSDFRKVDKIIMDAAEKEETTSSNSVSGGSVLKDAVECGFLYEQDDIENRNLRSHISLSAFINLVEYGFSDPIKTEDLQSSIKKIDFEAIGKNCEDVEEIIDLSDSDVEMVERIQIKCDESSSGLESEETTPVTPRKRIAVDTVTSDDEVLTVHDFEDFCELFGQKIPLKVSRDKAYIGKSAVLKILNFPSALQKGSKVVRKLLEENGVCLDEAFLYEGRQRGFISVQALKIILSSEILQKFVDRDLMLEELSNIEDRVSNTEENNLLVLKSSSDNLKYRRHEGSVYLDMAKLTKIANLFPSLEVSIMNNHNICKVLANRGIDVDTCFLRQGKSKNAYIDLHAAIVLIRSNPGHKNPQEEQENLVIDIISRLREKGAVLPRESVLHHGIHLYPDHPPVHYRSLDGHLYLHRKTCFEILQLESAILSNKKGYGAINSILTMCGLQLSACYLPTKNQKYSYISCLALIRLLESKDPLIVCLSNKDQFLMRLFGQIQTGALAEMGSVSSLEVGSHQLKVLCQGETLYLHRHTAYDLSGLYEARVESRILEDPNCLLEERGLVPGDCFIPEQDDRFGWISLHALSILLTIETEAGDGSVAWRDLLSAVAIQEPRLRARINMDKFRAELLSAVLAQYTRHLDGDINDSTHSTHSTPHSSQVDLTHSLETDQAETYLEVAPVCRDVRRPSYSDHVVPSNSCPASPTLSTCLHSPLPLSLSSPSSSSSPDSCNFESVHPSLTAARYHQMKTDILAAAGGVGGTIGGWEVLCADTVTRLKVRPGYGASRKVSFLRPDYAAILSYNLLISPNHASLCLNNSAIPANIIETMLQREEKEGTLSFLYQLISLRPCFGSFSPELVETVRQWDEETMLQEKVYIDTSFIGTSGSGRTYAGTVRTNDCTFIACDRVSDFCIQCKHLTTLTINRSLLFHGTGEKRDQPNKVSIGTKASQKSVWQLATTTADGCSFVCPQAQSFNTSLPHAFDGASQATAVVEHRAEIGNNLSVWVQLSGRPIARNFPDFQLNRQLGPLLDWVAGLRLCVGYPAHTLVTQATFLHQNRSRLRPDLQKLFGFLVVDTDFSYTESDGDDLVGTIRSRNCQTAAETGADICHQCRLLQEPIEFLNV